MNTASQKQLSLLRKLKQKSTGERLGVFLAEGFHTIEQIASNKILQLDELFIDFEHDNSKQINTLLSSGFPADRVYATNKSTMKELSDTDHSSGWLATIASPKLPFISRITMLFHCFLKC